MPALRQAAERKRGPCLAVKGARQGSWPGVAAGPNFPPNVGKARPGAYDCCTVAGPQNCS
eukprot:11860373-Heterocapsa_arctica.AAC.1